MHGDMVQFNTLVDFFFLASRSSILLPLRKIAKKNPQRQASRQASRQEASERAIAAHKWFPLSHRVRMWLSSVEGFFCLF